MKKVLTIRFEIISDYEKPKPTKVVYQINNYIPRNQMIVE